MKRTRLLASILIVVAVFAGLCGTAQAQEPQTQIIGEITAITPAEGGYVITLLNEDGDTSDVFIPEDVTIHVDDETLTPADLEMGWTITVTATQREDGTLYATSVTVDDEDDETEEGWQHPVAARLADYFGMNYDELMAYHESGVGFGLLARACFLAESLADEEFTVEGILAMKESGKGFGYFFHEYGIHPGSYNLGAVMSGKGAQWKKEKGEPPGHAHRNTDQEQHHNHSGQTELPLVSQMKKNDTDQNWTPPGQAKKDKGKTGQ
jgi:hypothetical protein